MFAGFSDVDFEAYAPKKWKSNVYNRERLEVKQKLLALGRAVEGRLTAADGSMLTLEVSVEHPAQWNHRQVEAQHIFFSRNEGARKELDRIIDRAKPMASILDDPSPQRNHLFLAVTVNHERVEVALRLHPDARIDRQNLERKIADHFECERLLNALGALPPGASMGLGAQRRDVAGADAKSLLASVGELTEAAARSSLPGVAVPLWSVGVDLPRAEVVAAGAAFVERVGGLLEALLRVYRQVAWSRENDFVLMRETLQKERQTKKQRGLAKNDEVKIVRGLLSGKSGIVQEVDARGGLRVLVGKMAVKLEAEDVAKV